MRDTKPCPFCGWGTIVEAYPFFGHGCECHACGAKTKRYKTWDEAVKAWNRREGMSDFITVEVTPSKGHGLYFDKYGTDNLDEIIEKYKEEQRNNPPRDADGCVIRDGFLETIITMRERR